jgi:DNA-binding NarL/FixJ family response regulator
MVALDRVGRVLKTLIVEDSTTFRNTFKEALCRQFPFMVVEEVVDGAEALKNIKTSLPDVIFMDIRLPGESGLALTATIKASHPEIAVIILTAYDLPEYREAAYRGGADGFIPKSLLNLADIAALIESIFSHRGPVSGGPT